MINRSLRGGSLDYWVLESNFHLHLCPQLRKEDKNSANSAILRYRKCRFVSLLSTLNCACRYICTPTDPSSLRRWVFSTETISSAVSGQTVYDPSKSSTSSLKDGYTWEITYGDQSTSGGVVYSDVVSAFLPSLPPLSYPNFSLPFKYPKVWAWRPDDLPFEQDRPVS